MSAWDHPSKDLFRAGRGAGAMRPTPADRERVRARLAAKLGAAAVGAAITTTSATAAGATTAGATTAAAAKTSLLAKIVLPLLLIGGAATIAAPHLLKKAEPVVATPTPIATAPVKVTPVAPVAPTETTTVSVTDLPTATTAPAPVAHAVKTIATDPAEEARAVAAIDDALRTGDAARALALADDHAKKFPNGVLVEEREGGRAIARCMNGSRASADAFLAAHPRSPMRGRILAACNKETP